MSPDTDTRHLKPETPIQMTRPVYLDNAATTPVRPEVRDAMLPYLSEEAFGNPSSAHQFGRTARAGIDKAKRQIAAALDAEPNQVIFTAGGTEADNLAVVGGALAARTQGGGGRSRPEARAQCGGNQGSSRGVNRAWAKSLPS